MGFYHVILNGKKRPASEASVSLFNPASLNGFGVYESVEVVDGVAFHLHDHLCRLAESARMIEMRLPYDTSTMAGWVRQLVVENGPQDCRVRIVVLGATNADDEPLVAVLPQEMPRYPDRYYREGMPLITFEGTRPLPMCKSVSTLVSYLARQQASRCGLREAILRTGDEMTEGSRSNVFAVCQDTLFTPPADRVLSGITREIIIRLAAEAGYDVSESPVYLSKLPAYREFLVTSTSMHVIPVVRIDDEVVGEGTVGPVTTDIAARFERYHRDYVSSNRATESDR